MWLIKDNVDVVAWSSYCYPSEAARPNIGTHLKTKCVAVEAKGCIGVVNGNEH